MPREWLSGHLRRTTRVAAAALAALALLAAAPAAAGGAFRVLPYVQNPAPDAMTIAWLSARPDSGTVTWTAVDEPSAPVRQVRSAPELAADLAYPAWEAASFFSGHAPEPPYRHRVRLSRLRPSTRYAYSVAQGDEAFTDTFRTAPAPDERRPVRFIFMADSETEPESTGKPAAWADPTGGQTDRLYPIDQTEGFARNLAVVWSRQPDLVGFAGDLVESGGEQRDWDEFWWHVTGVAGRNLAGRIPLLAAPGNHEYYEGPRLDGYEQPGSERAIRRFLTYFEVRANGSPEPADDGRYHRVDYGPVTLLFLDVANNPPHQSTSDTNYYLRGQGDPGGGGAPGFGPGTRQYDWLEAQLADAQQRSAFTFVVFHHVPYSVGPHGWPPGPTATGLDPQSGVPVRALVPLFHQYGVDAVIAGHDEIWERSQVDGRESRRDGSTRPHSLHVFDVGVAGDGLRAPEPGLTNPYQAFLVHTQAPERWEDGVLVDGGKHYGHLEIDVLPADAGGWQAVLKPVYVFPLPAPRQPGGLPYERRIYDDIVTLTAAAPATAVADVPAALPPVFALQPPYPNPFNSTVLLRYELAVADTVRLEVFDAIGQRVRCLVDRHESPGSHSVEWDGNDAAGFPAASGVYVVRLCSGPAAASTQVTLAR